MKNLLLLSVILLTSCNLSSKLKEIEINNFLDQEVTKELKEINPEWTFKINSYTTKEVDNYEEKKWTIDSHKELIKKFRSDYNKLTGIDIHYSGVAYLDAIEELEQEIKDMLESIERSPRLLQYKVIHTLYTEGKVYENQTSYIYKEI